MTERAHHRRIVHALIGVAAGLCAAGPAHAQRVVAFGDEWVLSNSAFSNAPAATQQLASQLTTFVTNGQSNTSVLMWTGSSLLNPNDTTPLTGGSQFRSFLTSQGHTVQNSQVYGLTLPTLQQYHVVGVDWNYLNASTAPTLTQYVNGGGSVVVFGGRTLSASEPSDLNSFLNNFNIQLNDLVGPTQTIEVPVGLNNDPVGAGLPTMTWGRGHAVSLLNYLDPNSSLVEGQFDSPLGQQWAGIMATYNGVPAPGATLVLAFAGLLTMQRRRA